MTRSRNIQSRLLRATGLLAGLAGLAVSIAGPAVASPAEEPPAPAEPIAAQTTAAPATPDQTTRSTADARHGYQAIGVSLIRSGGGRNSVYSLQGNGGGHSRQIYRLASSPAFLALRSAYVPARKSGKARYELTVQYRNGREKTVVTYSGTPAPRVLTDLIREIERNGAPKFPKGFPFSGGGSPFGGGFPFNDQEF